MRMRFFSTIAIVLFAWSAQAWAGQCAAISCDCGSLGSDEWIKTCKARQKHITQLCNQGKGPKREYCSVHGPKANRLPFDIDMSAVDLVALTEVDKLNKKVAALYWAIINDFNTLEDGIKAENFTLARQKLRTINANVGQLFVIERQVAYSFSENKQASNVQKAWRNYSEDTFRISNDFLQRSKILLKTADGKNKADLKNLGVQLAMLAGRSFEQAGYAYHGSLNHKQSAAAWMQAAQAASMVAAHSTGTTGDHYRQQAAARLHRASYHWHKAGGQREAVNALLDSKEFMTDAKDISELIDYQSP